MLASRSLTSRYVVQNALLHFDGERYRLLTSCIMILMPNVAMWLIEIVDDYSLSSRRTQLEVVHRETSEQSRSVAHGPFWHPDYFDRYHAQTNDHLAQTSRVCRAVSGKGRIWRVTPSEWMWSSARFRKSEDHEQGLEARGPARRDLRRQIELAPHRDMVGRLGQAAIGLVDARRRPAVGAFGRQQQVVDAEARGRCCQAPAW